MLQSLLKKYLYQWILGFLLIPLLFIDINSFHNWGDDFAQYLCQARDNVNGTKFNEMPILDLQNIGPVNRGSAFSLLLSPLFFLFQLSVSPYLIFISTCLIILGFVLYTFFKKTLELKQTAIISIILVLVFVYNRHVLFIKTEILTVFPFMIVLYLIFLIKENNNSKANIISSILTGLLISLANIGWVLYLAMFTYNTSKLNSKTIKQNIKQLLISILLPLCVYLLVKLIAFKSLITDDITWYAPLFSIEKIVPVIITNAHYYKDVFFLNFDQDIWFLFNKTIKLLMLAFTLAGLFFKLSKNFKVYDLFFLFYLLLLLIYPDKSSGIRFLMPLVPIILIYSVYGFNLILRLLHFKSENIVVVYYACIFISYFQNLGTTIKTYANENDGPYQKESIEAFDFIRDSTNKKSRIAFFKPWVIKLYAQRAAMPITAHQSLLEITTKMKENRVEYLLLNLNSKPEEMFNKSVITQIEKQTQFKCNWSNKRFRLYQLN